MGDYEQAVERLRDEGLEDLAEVFERFGTTTLRKKASERDQYETRVKELESKLQEAVVAPKKLEALRSAGVDVDSLRPAELEVVRNLTVDEDKIGEGWATQIVERYGLPTTGEVRTSEQPAAAAMVQAARQTPGKVSTPGINPEAVSEWSVEKMTAFAEKHPEAWEALKRGETVTGVTD